MPEVIVVPELLEDELARKRAERLIHIADQAGPLVMAHGAEAASGAEEDDGPSRFPTFLDALLAAADGDQEALQLVDITVGTDMTERTYKAGHITEIGLEFDAAGNVSQHGQRMDDVHINALRFASGKQVIRNRSEAEMRNGMRLKPAVRLGRLETHYWVVLSRCAVGMTDEELQECGFFADTKSCAIQVIGMEDGRLFQETAFVAGVAELGGERHDEKSIVNLGRALGVDLSGKSPDELLDTPLLVPKTMMSNGAIDLVRLYDNGAHFFGQDKPSQDYLAYLEICRQREAAMGPTKQAIIQELLADVSNMRTPADAANSLSKLSAKHLVVLASKDKTIDARVFGEEAAPEIIMARAAYVKGDIEAYSRHVEKAQELETSFTCPMAAAAAERAAANGEGRDISAIVSTGTSKAERKRWKTKPGVCVVRTCPTRPGKTEVGPCGVCMERCQLIFDDGGDPTGGAILISSAASRPKQDVLPVKEKTAQVFQFLGGMANRSEELATAA